MKHPATAAVAVMWSITAGSRLGAWDRSDRGVAKTNRNPAPPSLAGKVVMEEVPMMWARRLPSMLRQLAVVLGPERVAVLADQARVWAGCVAVTSSVD